LTYFSESQEWVRAKILSIIRDELNEVSEMDCDLIDFGMLKTIKAEE
jgi:hypothetical protein